MKQLVSIVLPTYNRAQEIKVAINSVLSQSYDNWELIIIDNFSNDGTEEEVSKINDNRIKFYKIRNDGIIAKSRNLGIKNSKGEIISFLDSDDWWKDNKLETAVNYINKGYDFTFHRLIKVNPKRKYFFHKKTYSYNLTSPVFESLISGGSCIPNSSVTLTRGLVTSLGEFDESKELVGAEDFDGWLKISKHSNKFIQIPKTLGYCLIGSNNFSSDENLLRNLEAIEKSHLTCSATKSIAASFDYTRARIYQRKKFYRKAIKFYMVTLRKKPNRQILLKSIFALFILRVCLIITYKDKISWR